MKSLSVMSMLILSLSACAYQAQVVRLNPAISATAGSAKLLLGEIALRVRDVRTSIEIGKRSAGTRGGASITSGPEVVDSLKTATTRILESKGLRAVEPDAAGERKIDLQLRELTYASFMENGDQKVRILARLWVLARRGSQTFEKTYEANQERKILVEPIAKSNEEWINETLSDAFREISNDTKLDAFLKAKS